MFSTNINPLTPTSEEVELQKILWSPGSYDSNLASNSENNNKHHKQQFKRVLPNSGGSNKAKVKFEKSKLSQAIAFIHDYDIYYKPKIHSDLVIRVTTNGEWQIYCIRNKLNWIAKSFIVICHMYGMREAIFSYKMWQRFDDSHVNK